MVNDINYCKELCLKKLYRKKLTIVLMFDASKQCIFTYLTIVNGIWIFYKLITTLPNFSFNLICININK